MGVFLFLSLFVGQFWNIPVNITKYNGNIDGGVDTNYYIVSVNHPKDPPRQFVGRYYDASWDSENKNCLYVGSRQGGKIREVESPNDPVIRGSYREYVVGDAFETRFAYSVFDESSVCNN